MGLIPLKEKHFKKGEKKKFQTLLKKRKVECKSWTRIQILCRKKYLKMITDSFCEIWCCWRATKIRSSILPLCNCAQDSILDPISLVMELQMAQHCYRTQQQSSWICQILGQVKQQNELSSPFWLSFITLKRQTKFILEMYICINFMGHACSR